MSNRSITGYHLNTFTICYSRRFSSAREFQMGNFQKYWSQNVGQDFIVLDFFVGGDRPGEKGVCGRLLSPAHETQSMREIRLLRGRLPRKGGGLTGMAPFVFLNWMNKENIGLCRTRHDSTATCRQGITRQMHIKSNCGHSIFVWHRICLINWQLYFGHLSCFTISSVKYDFQICKISEFWLLLDPFSK